MIVVKFLAMHGSYNPDENAGFPPEIAHGLVKAGVADYVNEDDRPKSEAAEFEGSQTSADSTELQLSVDELRAELGKKNKAELVGIGKNEFGLELSTDSKKEELVEAIVTAAATAESAQK